MRLDRFVSQAAGVSRRQARQLIRTGKVRVADVPLRDPAAPVDEHDSVWCDGRRVQLPGAIYLMLHKPCGLLSATRDSHQTTVLSLLPDDLAKRVHLVGRLDKDTSGLLLLTDDGDWSHRITSPRHQCAKTYRARLAEPLCADAEARLAQGLLLRGESRPTRPAELQRVSEQEVLITVYEGRYHQVRRMFAALGNRVLTLHRERIGALVLEAALRPGQWRALSQAEREQVLACEP